MHKSDLIWLAAQRTRARPINLDNFVKAPSASSHILCDGPTAEIEFIRSSPLISYFFYECDALIWNKLQTLRIFTKLDYPHCHVREIPKKLTELNLDK